VVDVQKSQSRTAFRQNKETPQNKTNEHEVSDPFN
jgi:hypothetical protein